MNSKNKQNKQNKNKAKQGKKKGPPPPRKRNPPPKRRPGRVAPGPRVRTVTTVSQATSQMRLSECALRYARAIADPWADTALQACVPVATGLTQKVTGYVRDSMQLGTAGYGYILMSPCLANDAICYVNTSASFAGTNLSIAANNTFEAGVAGYPLYNLPYNAAQLINRLGQSVVSGRVVACSVRVRYTGTNLNMGGLTYCLRDPQHNSVQSSRTAPFVGGIASWGARRESSVDAYGRKFCSVSDYASKETEMELNAYSNEEKSGNNAADTAAVYPFSLGSPDWFTGGGAAVNYLTAGVLLGAPTLGVQIMGKAGETCEFEIIEHVEYAGAIPTALTTETVADITGSQLVVQAANTNAIHKQGTGRDPWTTLSESLRTSMAKAAHTYIVPAAASAVDALLNGATKSIRKIT